MADTSHPSITLDPKSTTIGQHLSVSGIGFAQNSSVKIMYDDVQVSTVTTEVKTTDAGKFVAQFVIPANSTDGIHIVKVSVAGNDPVTSTVMIDAPMSLSIRILLVSYYFSLLIVSGYLLISHWQLTNLQQIVEQHPETRYILLAGLFGLMGSSVHGISSLTVWAGNQKLAKSWGWWYLTHPPTGAILAILIYFVIRAGLISGSSASLSYYGVAAVGAIAGLSTKHTMAKLRDVLDSLFGTSDAKKGNKAEDKPQT